MHRKNIPFRITKTGGPRSTSWKVERLDSTERQLEESIAIARTKGERPAGQPSAPGDVYQMPSKAAECRQVDVNANGMTIASKILASCLIAAMDAANAAELYGESKGLDYGFGAEDVRALSITLYIQHAKTIETQYLAQQQNGGTAKWQQ